MRQDQTMFKLLITVAVIGINTGHNGRLGMADIVRIYGGHMANIRQTYGEHTANGRLTYSEHTANIRRTYGKHTANIHQKLPRTYAKNFHC